MNELWRSVFLKIGRAEAQAKYLGELISDWSFRNNFDADLLYRDGRLGVKLVLKEFKEPAPLNDWGLIFGECIHNLRSSLDNLAFALARLRRDPPENPKDISFPIYQDEQDFKRKGRRSLRQLPDEAATLIERLQPFQRDGSAQSGNPENDQLLALQVFNNLDKHQVPAVVLVVPTELKYNISTAFHTDAQAAANTPPNIELWPGPFVPGAVLMEYKTTHELKSCSLQVDGSASVAVSGLAELVPPSEILSAMQQYVKLVALQFAHFFEVEEDAQK